MAHKKAGSSKARQGSNVAGKRLGIKKYGGSVVKPGEIIVRQRGQVFIPGDNVKMGRDFTLFSMAKGTVAFEQKTRSKKRVKVIPQVVS